MRTKKTRGFSLTELMVALAVTSLAMVSIISFHVTHKVRTTSEDLNIEVQQNLRLALDRLVSSVRNSNYGVPPTSLGSWVTWVSGFSSNRSIASGPPDSITVAGCGLQSLTTIATNAAAGATSITVTSAAGFNATNKRLIYIDDNENAMIKSVSGNTLTIDTDPSASGNQGLSKAYPAGTAICRVDVTTYSIDTTKRTLQADLNQGGAAIAIADGINAMSIVVNSAGIDPEYAITLTGQSSKKDPTNNALVQATLSGKISPLK